MIIVKASVNDAVILTEITKKSKSFWGYSAEQILIWSDLLTITKEYITDNYVFKLKNDDETIGYYSYSYDLENSIKLDNLFVLPEYIGNGFGKLLMNDFLNRIKDSQMQAVLLDSEPNAEKFYSKFGFNKIGELETSIKNRFLPIMELKIKSINSLSLKS